MIMLHYGRLRDLEAQAELSAALAGADISEPDDVGALEITLETGR